jgi:hypothetical protein
MARALREPHGESGVSALVFASSQCCVAGRSILGCRTGDKQVIIPDAAAQVQNTGLTIQLQCSIHDQQVSAFYSRCASWQ